MGAARDGGDRPLDTVGVLSTGLLRLPGLATFLGARRLVPFPSARQARELCAVVGWGHKPTADRARAYARRHRLPYVGLEDGFLRSVGVGPEEPTLSLVVDDEGIYYDARGPSRLESILAAPPGTGDALADEGLRDRARRCRERIVAAGLSKYNHAPDALPTHWAGDDRPIVLVVDQTYGDAAVTQGLAGPDSFDQMLAAARDEHRSARIVVKVHPVTSTGKKQGYLAARPAPPGVEYLPDPINPVALLRRVDHVYVCTSQLGFEGLMVGKPVTCFGAPFYAGWGLTDDRVAVDRRGRTRSLDELVAAALLLYPRYRHPIGGQRCDAEDVIEHLARQRRMFAQNARTFFCLGFSTWKRPFVRRYLSSPGREVRFVRSWSQLARQSLPPEATVVLWGTGQAGRRLRSRQGDEVPVWRMEDGFLRSVRLGSELTPPGSLVVDRAGIYYDPTVPSDLERILQETAFSAAELRRAARLRRQVVDLKVSKYNLSQAERFAPTHAPGQPVILVPGQVEDDASMRLGSPHVRDDGALLHAVRRRRPDAHVVYKPHPDVLSGNRRGAIPDDSSGLYDDRVEDVSLPACLAVADEVHCMTSLVGFEALLRGLPVTTYGRPFYAGWGLTEDRHPLPRRTRRLTLDELVAGTLIRYPRYYSWEAQAFCAAEDMVQQLASEKAGASRWSFRTPWVVRRLRDLAILSWEWVHA